MITKNEKLTEEKDKVKIKRNKMFDGVGELCSSAHLDFLSHEVRKCFYCLSHHELGFLFQLLGAK